MNPQADITDETRMGEVDPRTLAEWLARGEAVLIDVREADEHAHERIRGARLLPLSRFDPSRIDRRRRTVFMCRSGNRTAMAEPQFLALGLPETHHLKGGILAWKASGLPVDKDARAPLPIMRQVQIIVGAGVLAGLALGWFLSPWFLLLSAFMAAGLMTAGITGFCGMARLLAVLPHNRPSRHGAQREATGG